MSREGDFKTRMAGSAPLMAVLTGGVYTREETGREGIVRGQAATDDAFDAVTGFLKPCALIKQRDLVPDGVLRDEETQIASAVQVIEVYLYQDTGYTSIDAALPLLVTLFMGHRFSDTFPVEWINLIDREQEEGALKGASLARVDFLVRTVEDF